MKFFLFVLVLTFLASCQEVNPKKDQKPQQSKHVEPLNDCTYGIRSSAVMFRWLAFKTTERIGVSGTFGDIRIKTDQKAPSLQALFESVSFEIDTKSILSNDDGRDKKLIDFFFAKLVEGQTISGKVKSVDVENKKGVFSLKMNGVSQDMPFNFSQEKKELIVTGFVDLNKWSAQAALESINQSCEEKHKGADGISKTWPDVNIDIRIPLIMNCK